MSHARAPRIPVLGNGGSARGRFAWPGAMVCLTLLIACARLLVNPRFYFADDTERGSLGQWWQLGDYLSQGRLPVLDPSAWQAGNYFAEGQWGLLSPVTWIIGLAVRGAENPIVQVTIIKIAFLVVFAIGMYLLAREFGAARPWAALVGVMAPAAGFTVYMDAPSWSTGLFNAAVFPLVWWTLRRAVEGGRSPIPYLIASLTLITFGYVYGVIVLVLLLVESLVRHSVRRDGKRALRVVAASAWGALWTIIVYLPGIMTAPVTKRGDEPIGNFLFLNADLTDLASAGSPWVTATIHAWWGDTTSAPLVYVAWALPLLALALPMPRALVRRCIPLFVIGGAMLIAVLAPSHLGPLRWPVRMMPYLVIAVLVLFAVAMTRAFPARITRLRAGVAVGLVLSLAYVSYVNEMVAWRSILVTAALHVAAVLAVVWFARFPRTWTARRRTAVVVAGALAVTLGVTAVQLDQFPRTPLPSVGMPDDAKELTSVLAEPHGDGIVVGNGEQGTGDPASWHERLMANLWYLSPSSISSLYTVLPYSEYADDLCSDLRGVTCARALNVLWSIDDETDTSVADLLSLSTIVAMKATYPEQPHIPDGWHLAEEGTHTWLLQRDEALPDAGGVSWTGEGISVTVTHRTDTAVTFTVDDVGADPRVVFSRLHYPGYSVSGASFADPLRGYLLTVDVSDVEPGQEVTVRFLPPPFPVLVASFVLALIVAGAWLAVRSRVRRRVSAG